MPSSPFPAAFARMPNPSSNPMLFVGGMPRILMSGKTAPDAWPTQWPARSTVAIGVPVIAGALRVVTLAQRTSGRAALAVVQEFGQEFG